MQTQAFKRPESVLIVIYTQTGQVLLMERLQPAQFWQSVTGSLEEDETPQITAERELFEETGIDDVDVVYTHIQNIYPIHPAWRHRYHPAIQFNKEYVFKVELPEQRDIQYNLDEHCAIRWLDKSLAVELCSSVSNTRAIELLVKTR